MVDSDTKDDLDTLNRQALDRLFAADPVLVDVQPAGDVLPGMTKNMILASGPTMSWEMYGGGQRAAILGAAVYEKLAPNLEAAEDAISAGDIEVAGCQDFGCVGSLAGVTSASMPVFVVQDAKVGNQAYCTLFEGASPARLNYGVYNDDVQRNLEYLADLIAPILRAVVRSFDAGIALRPIIERALRQGDELHSRNTAASNLFLREVLPALIDLESSQARELVSYLTAEDYFFLRLSMAAAKCMADQMVGVAGSSVVTAMAISCREFGIKVSGLGDTWFRGPLPELEAFRLFGEARESDIEIMGGESVMTEVCGLGGLAQAAAFPLQAYQGGYPDDMVRRNMEMYEIAVGEHPSFKIPYLAYRGTPAGIDVRRVAETGITPVMDVGIAGRYGGQIGAGIFRAPLSPFVDAWAALGGERGARSQEISQSVRGDGYVVTNARRD